MPVREVTCAAELAPDTKTAANDQTEMQRKVSPDLEGSERLCCFLQ